MIYTFYSYKGGVGRSMALANIAECFREKRLRVLMVDWDLEAPGLEVYFFSSPDGEVKLEASRRHPGLIDLLNDYKAAYPKFIDQRAAAVTTPAAAGASVQTHGPEEIARATEAFTATLNSIDIPEFLRKSAMQTLAPQAEAKPPEPAPDLSTFLDRLYRGSPGPGGVAPELASSPLAKYVQRAHDTEGLYLLSAGARGPDQFRSYAAAVQDFDWAEFYTVYEGRRYFEWLRTRLGEIADVVLIDSRTGVTEMGGVCTRQMPDAVVSFCAPNWQNVDGVVRVVAGLNDDTVRAARDNREVDALVVPTRIDDAESTLLQNFRDRFVATAESTAIPTPFEKLENPLWNLQIPYIPRYNYREQRVVGPNAALPDPPTERLIAAYKKLTVHLAVLPRSAEDLKVKEAFNTEIAAQFPHLGTRRTPRQAPRPIEGYVQRPEQDSKLASLLREGLSAALWGRAGSGKTATAAWVVNQPEIEQRFPDGTLWLPGDQVWTPESVITFFRTSFGLASSYREAAISDDLASRRFLVVIPDVREPAAVDRILKLCPSACCLLLTRDLAQASRFSRNVVTVGDYTPEQSRTLIGSERYQVLDSPEYTEMLDAFLSWPAGAAAIRAFFDLAALRDQPSHVAWAGLMAQVRALGVGVVETIPVLATGYSIPRAIRDAVGQLEPAERRDLVAAAGGENLSKVRPRLADFGMLENGRVAPIVRLWLAYTRDLPDPFVRGAGQPDPLRLQADQDREQAQRILRGENAPVDVIVAIAQRLKNVRSCSLARRLLGRATRMPEFNRVGEKLRLKIIQQYALCTYKDEELPGGERYSRAIAILETGDLSDSKPCQETLGLAGAAFKNLWRQRGQRADLERSYSYYERGAKGLMAGDYGYTRLNAAFVLDLLACDEAGNAPEMSESHRAQTRLLRQEIIDKLPILAAAPEHAFLRDQWWYYATMAEACFGLGRFEAARFWLRSGLGLSVPEWEKESTTRQLADLAAAQGLALAEHSEVWQTLRVLVGDSVAALRGVAAGKVGLALSGGGFRASLFHIGVLAKLAEADVLRHVEVLSCVSGGSIVGAHLYLELRRLLQTKADHEITREDYIEIVRRMQRDFLDGVQGNLRTKLFRSWFANFLTLFKPGYTRTHHLGRMYEEEIYARVQDGYTGPRYLRELRIHPAGAADTFNPKLDNWRRSARVPIVLLNATTLNTGHNWQFAVTWMGEPPPSEDSVDANDVLRRMYYDDEAPAPYRDVRLGLAVAASSCVPGLFDPVEMPGLYPSRIVRLVDGGVHDNQGIAGLLEQECRVMLVSDASGHMNSERISGAEVTTVPLRSNSILMARVREAQFREIDSLRRSSALTGLMFLHLKKDLNVSRVDWVDCQDPYEASDEADAAAGKRFLTSYGIPRRIQELLAGIRTDLDTFSDAEAYALMLSGYRMAESDLGAAVPLLAASDEAREPWDFLAIDRVMTARVDTEEDQHRRLLAVLEAARSGAFKVWKLSTPAVVLGCVLLAAFGFLAWTFRPWFAVGVKALGAALGIGVPVLWAGHRLFGVRKSFTVLVSGIVMVTVGWIVAAFHLALFDPIYRRVGRVKTARTPRVAGDAVSLVVVVAVFLVAIVGGWFGLHGPGPADTAASIAAEGFAARQAGNLTLALDRDTAAINHARSAPYLRERAYVYKLLSRFEDSRQDLESAQALAPDAQTAADLAYVETLLNPTPATPPSTPPASQPEAIGRGRLYVSVTSPAQMEPMKRLTAQLRGPTPVVPQFTVQPAKPDVTQLRYVHSQDAKEAAALVERLRRLGLKVEGPVAVRGDPDDRPGHFELWIASDASIPQPSQPDVRQGLAFPVKGWCYQEAASPATAKMGFTHGFAAYCHANQKNCEAGAYQSKTASRCVYIDKIGLDEWGGESPEPRGYLGSWYRRNMDNPLARPFPPPPEPKKY